jgi:hypothetical protein
MNSFLDQIERSIDFGSNEMRNSRDANLSIDSDATFFSCLSQPFTESQSDINDSSVDINFDK